MNKHYYNFTKVKVLVPLIFLITLVIFPITIYSGLRFGIIDAIRGKTEELKEKKVEELLKQAPIITSLTATPSSVSPNGNSTITCTASDPDGDTLSYSWTATGGAISGSGSQVTWTAPSTEGTYTITCTVSDGKGGTDQKTVNISVTLIQGEKLWTRQSGTSAWDDGEGVATDGSGNIYVTGETGGSLDGQAHAGAEDIFLIKYDSNGNKLWTKQSGTNTWDTGDGVAVDGSGNIYVAGSTRGGLDGNVSAGGSDIFLMKYDTNGTKLWTVQSGTSTDDWGEGVATDGSGNIYVTGYTGGSLDGQAHAGSSDIFLIKYSSDGTKLWTKQSGTSASDWGNGVATDGSGNIYVTGGTEGGLDGTNAGMVDIFLMKYDIDGNKLWTKQSGTSASDWGSGVAIDGSGNIYVTGGTGGSLDGQAHIGGRDIFLIKYDSAGNKIWTSQSGTSASDGGEGVTTDGSGNIYVTGWTYGGLDGQADAGEVDIFLMKYAPDGTKLWTRQSGTSGDDSGSGVATDGSENIYVTGGAQGSLDGQAHAGGVDIFLIKYGP